MHSDIVIDANVMCLYDAPADPRMQGLFRWVATTGSLALSNQLIAEYGRTGNRLIGVLVDHLTRLQRLNKISNGLIKSFTLDAHYPYKCNRADIPHARLVFLSDRKRLVSRDKHLVTDVAGFRRVNGVQPVACFVPHHTFYT